MKRTTNIQLHPLHQHSPSVLSRIWNWLTCTGSRRRQPNPPQPNHSERLLNYRASGRRSRIDEQTETKVENWLNAPLESYSESGIHSDLLEQSNSSTDSELRTLEVTRDIWNTKTPSQDAVTAGRL